MCGWWCVYAGMVCVFGDGVCVIKIITGIVVILLCLIIIWLILNWLNYALLPISKGRRWVSAVMVLVFHGPVLSLGLGGSLRT